MKNKWIIFDAMGVIYTVGDDTNDLLVPFIRDKNPEISKEYINECYMDASLGEITSDEFWNCMNIGNTEKACEEYLDTKLKIDEQFISTAEELKKKYKLAVLSNDVYEWSLFLRKKYGLDRLIDEFIISGKCKLRKPNKDIYMLALKKLNEKAENCLFIDDREKNLLPAVDLGMKAIKFNRENEENISDNLPSINNFSELIDQLSNLPY